ncbi:hypothetical protein RCL06_24260, partial [Salmonella enterica subsp. enterica serovar Typhimurium]
MATIDGDILTIEPLADRERDRYHRLTQRGTARSQDSCPWHALPLELAYARSTPGISGAHVRNACTIAWEPI